MTTLAFSINIYTRELVQIYSETQPGNNKSQAIKDKVNHKLINFAHEILLAEDPAYLTLSL
jgi:hypothetical protein